MDLHLVPKKGTIVPIMGAVPDNNLSAALFGKTRRVVLSLLYGHADEAFYIRYIVRVAGAGHGAVQRELRQLSNAGVIQRTVRGRQVYYQANQKCPVFTELKSLIIKTAGIGDILKDALAPLVDRINVAFIYGSMAQGKESKGSDVDIMVVGNVTFGDIVGRFGPAQEMLGREINPTVYPLAEFQSKVAAGHHFLKEVLAKDKVYLIGDEHELERVAGEWLAY